MSWRIAHTEANPINPQLVAWELSAHLPDNCIISADSGTTANWYGRDIKMRAGMQGSLSGGLATMGAAVPYAIAAKFAYPDRVPVCFTGDGAMQMNGINELITVGKYWQRWSDPRLVFVILNNRDLNQVTWEMRTEEGNPKLPATQTLPDFPYARFAELIGLQGIRVERPEDIAGAFEQAFSANRPIVLDVYTDPEVPTLPPHITIEQAKNYASSILKGDEDNVGIVEKSVKELAKSVLPHKNS
jgi:pyruvate dehydrogenase (quinone)